MTDKKRKRMSMLDDLAAARTPSPAPPAHGVAPMVSTNRALRAARDAVDGHSVWELEPHQILDDRLADRLDPNDVIDLMDAIEENGQTVPILVRRAPDAPETYTLVYGRRRLEAIRRSDKVHKVRALIADLDDDSALRAQISENMARRDLSFIEKAIFAKELIDNGFGNQSRVAEVLTVSRSSVSMALAVVDQITPDLIRAIGPAHGVGRPKWEALGRTIEESGLNIQSLVERADAVHAKAELAYLNSGGPIPDDPSVDAFDAVIAQANTMRGPTGTAPKPANSAPANANYKLQLDGEDAGTMKRTKRGVALEIKDGPFANWIETEGQMLIEELHLMWKTRSGL